MPYILQRLEYSGNWPRIGVVDADSGYFEDIDLGLGCKIPGLAFWTDRRYCRCGTKITKRQPDDEDIDPILVGSLNYMCPSCARGDQLNACTINGVWRDNKWRVACHQCYKWSSECATGFCVYIAMLTASQTELKVGITRLGRKNLRAAEAGYSFMGILMPENRNSLSLPEAEFLEKRILAGQAIKVRDQLFKVNERFTRDVGMVGNEMTRKLTYDALLCSPNKGDEQRFSDVLDAVIQVANARCANYKIDPEALGLTPLTLVEVIGDEGGRVDTAELGKMSYNDLTAIKPRLLEGRRYRRIPEENEIIGVKGPCVLMRAVGLPVVFRLNKHSVAGREIFDPLNMIDRGNSREETNLDWF